MPALPELTLVSAREHSQGMLKKALLPRYMPHPVKKTTSFLKSHPGMIIILRLKKQDKPYVLSVANRFLKILPNEPLEHHLWIVEEGRIRVSGG